MTSFLFHLKGQVTVLNGIFLLCFFAYILYRYNRKRFSRILFITAAVVFLLSSTAYLPDYLTQKLERQYPALLSRPAVQGKVYIHLLGSGYSTDKSIPASSQLGPAATGRMIEALHVYNMFDSAVLVTSGNAMHAAHEPTQAQVTKNAAMLLGISESRIQTLDSPATTKEEAKAFADRFGTNAAVIVVTDAMHMPRAIKMFQAAGLSPIAAPTNYKIPDVGYYGAFAWWPAAKHMTLMDLLLHEYFAGIKAGL